MQNILTNVLIASFLLISSLSSSLLAQEEQAWLNEGEAVQQQSDASPEMTLKNSQGKNKISLDIKGMDIVDVMKMLASRSGLNIAVGKNVTGKANLFLKDVYIWDAFEIIVLANDLAYEKNGGIINVMTQTDYEYKYGERFQDKKQAKVVQLKYAKASDLAKALDQMKTGIGRIVIDEGSNTLALMDTSTKVKDMEDFIKNVDLPIQTRVFALSYSQAEKLSPKIQEVVTKSIGSVKTDERTNKIIVTDYPQKLDEIANIIKAFDEKTPQVLIDAQIIELKPSDKFEMGVDWDFWIKKHFKIASSLPLGTTGRLLMGTESTTPSVQGEYKAILDLLRTIGDTKILSSPRIMVVNNNEARILVGTKDAYITSTTSQGASGSTVTSQAVNFVDVGIKLYVTPIINPDNFITMKIRPEISSATYKDVTSEGKVTQIPIVTTSEAETTIMLKDGVTVVIGGLRKDQRIKTVKKIPLIGDIPLLGYFFRSTSDDVQKTELVILLTPHIMSGEDTYTDFDAIKPKEGVVLSMVKGDIVKEKLTKNALSTEYCKIVMDKVRISSIFSKSSSEKGKVETVFTLDSLGHLVSEPKIISSSNPNLDQITIESVKKASPFPPFTSEMKNKEESFHIVFDYK